MPNHTNRSPILANLVDNSIKSLRDIQGLSLILATNSAKTGVDGNTPESESNFKNSMVAAFEIQPNEIFRSVTIPPGQQKIITSDSPPYGYFRGDGSATTLSNRPYVVTEDGLLCAIFGNDKAMWHTEHYNSRTFKNDINFNRGTGVHQLHGGQVFAVVGKVFDGFSSLSDSYVELSNVEDSAAEHLHLVSKNDKSQATRICGSGNEQTTGTCCLYYNKHHYDSIQGRTCGPGEYYKCMGAKCYRCLEIAKAMDMHYVFNRFTGSNGTTGGTGDRCLNCDYDNPPTNCGPCDCSVPYNTDTIRLLSDNDLAPASKIKQNAEYASWWERNEGMVFIHLTQKFTNLPSASKKIADAYFDRDKFIKLVGPQDDGAKDTVYELDVRGKKGEAYITGIKLRSVGNYNITPEINFTELKKICPDAQPEWFNVVRVPNLHKEMHLLVGKTQTIIRKQIKFRDISEITDVGSFDGWAVGQLKTESGRPFFTHSTRVPEKARLTTANTMTVASSGGGTPVDKNGLILSSKSHASQTYTQESKELSISVTQAQQDSEGGGGSTSYVKLANIKSLTTTKVQVEIFSSNTNSKLKGDLKFSDTIGNIYTTSKSEPSTDPTSGELLDPRKTVLYNQTKGTISLPEQSLTNVKPEHKDAFSHQSIVLEMVLGTGEMLFE